MELPENYSLSREDIRLFLRPAVTNTSRQRWFDLRVSTAGLVGAALIYATALIPSLIRYQQSGTSTRQDLAAVVVTDNFADPLKDVPVASAQNETVTGQVFNYESLSISAPINWDIVYNEDDIQTALKTGIAHLKGTARPGEQGTSIITGHSSNFAWAKGDYKTVFAPLLKAQLNDTVTISYNNNTYTYQVTEVYEVEPSKVSLLQTEDGVNLRLITCTPLGSTRKRLIVDAKQVSPDPTNNQPFTGTPLTVDSIIATR